MQRQLSPATRWHLRSKLDDLLRKEGASRNSRAVGCARHELALRVRALHRGALYAAIPLAFAIHNAHANALPQPFCSRASLPTAARFLLSRSWPSGAGSQQRVKASSRSTISQALPRVRCNCFLRDLLRMVGMVSASRNRVRGVVFHLRDSSPGSWMENVS